MTTDDFKVGDKVVFTPEFKAKIRCGIHTGQTQWCIPATEWERVVDSVLTVSEAHDDAVTRLYGFTKWVYTFRKEHIQKVKPKKNRVYKFL